MTGQPFFPLPSLYIMLVFKFPHVVHVFAPVHLYGIGRIPFVALASSSMLNDKTYYTILIHSE